MELKELKRLINAVMKKADFNPKHISKHLSVFYAENDESDIETIMRFVAESCGVTVEEIKGSDKFRNMVQARQMFHYYIRKNYLFSLSKMGVYTNNNHSTVLQGIRVFENDLSTGFISEKYKTFTKKIESWKATS